MDILPTHMERGQFAAMGGCGIGLMVLIIGPALLTVLTQKPPFEWFFRNLKLFFNDITQKSLILSSF